MDNRDQIEYWNGPSGQRWAALQENTDRILAGITDAFVPFANAKSGEKVLDIGCGCGTTTLIFARALQPGGSATGIDISAPMLAVARERASAANAKIPFIEADAAGYDFRPVFDLAVSRFGVMFFADPVAAFRNIRRALVPRGRLAFVCWRSLAENGWAATPIGTARPLLPPQEPPDPRAPGPFAFAERARIEEILSGAGFRNIEIKAFDGEMEMGATADDAARQSMTIGPLARAIADLDEAVRDKIRGVVAATMQRYATPKGVLAPVACWFVKTAGGRG